MSIGDLVDGPDRALERDAKNAFDPTGPPLVAAVFSVQYFLSSLKSDLGNYLLILEVNFELVGCLVNIVGRVSWHYWLLDGHDLEIRQSFSHATTPLLA